MQRTSAAVTVIAATAILLLSGCAPHAVAHATTKPTVKAHPSATPSASASSSLPALPADVLFQISVTATASNGAVARLTETVHAPLAATSSQTADAAQLDQECDSWRSAFANVQFEVAEVSTTVTSGDWNPNDLLATDMAGYPVWTGDERPYQAYCATALPSIPGAARAVSPVGSPAPDSAGGWAIYRYGFSVPSAGLSSGAGDSTDAATPAPDTLVLSDCSIQLGSAASASLFASTWQASPQTNGGQSCLFGGT